jgi:alkylhydroperoxidase family enzyme
VAVTRADVTGDDIQALREAGYSDPQIVEIVLNVAYNVVTNYVNEAFKTEIDFPRAAPATRAA